ncbi:MAG: 30S ribosomal protein S8 [Clostridia bacterium]|nr:30S ribosomal protein S8 [Clostridia bacterium]
MVVTDPIADMLTRIRNAIIAKHEKVEIPRSSVKVAIAKILLEEGYVKSVEEIGTGYEGVVSILLKYGPKKESVITGLKRISKPGLRIYVNNEKLPKVLGGLGVAIMSTNRGIMTDKKARAANVGGEVMAYIW